MSAVDGPGFLERLGLYLAVLAAGSSFAILFSENAAGGAFGGFSLVSLFGGGAFVAFLGAALVGAVIGSAGKFRLVLLPFVAVAYTVVAVYGVPSPTPSWVRGTIGQVGQDLYQAANTMYVDPVPYAIAPGLFVVFIPMIMIICAFATSAALYERAPLISVATLGLTIGVLSTISFEDGAGPFFLVFMAGSLVLILFSGASGESRSLTGVGLAVALIVCVVVLSVPSTPLASAAVSPGSIDWTSIGTGGTSRLDVQADVGEYLNSGRDAELMRVSSTEPLYWRGGTLDSFDGVRWSSTTDEDGERGYGEEIAPGVPVRNVVQSVEVLQSETNLIFGGYRISGLSDDVASGAIRNADGSWTAGDPLTDGDEYRVLSEVPQPAVDQLRSSSDRYPVDVREKYLQLPQDTPDEVAETAGEIRANYDTSTPYAASRAVERYLSTDGDFTYNLEVNYRRADWAVEEFLGEGREGFCTQFATSMALVLREMDVPARVVYGATTGEEVDENLYLVRGANMHTWVEVYFPGVGWYPFDPTPGFSMPQTMQSDVPRIDSSLGAGLQDQPQENRALENPADDEIKPVEAVPEDDPSSATVSTDEGFPAWPVALICVVGLVALVPITKRMLLSRARPEDYYRDVAGKLTDSLTPGIAATQNSPALTVEERLMLLAGASGLDPAPFEDLAARYSAHLYSPDHEGRRELSRAYHRAMREYRRLSVWRRAISAVNPTSLFARGGKKLRRAGEDFLKAVRLGSNRLRRRP